MEPIQKIFQSPIDTLKSGIMAPSNDTSFSSHVESQFTSYEKDRQINSKQTLYTTR